MAEKNVTARDMRDMSTRGAAVFPTRNDLPVETRSRVIEILQHRLADSVDFVYQAKQAHWNVKGPNFIALHELFDKVHDEAREWTDSIAERLVALGGTAEGTVYLAAKRSSLKQYPLTANTGVEHVEALAHAVAQYGALTRKAIDQADELGDKDTADLFTGISRGTDQYLWFIEAHLQSDR